MTADGELVLLVVGGLSSVLACLALAHPRSFWALVHPPLILLVLVIGYMRQSRVTERAW